MLQNFSIKNWKKNIGGIGLEISSDCNLRCKYCYYYGHTENSSLDPVTDTKFYDSIDTILDNIFNDFPNVRSIDFWGAEPLLHIDRIKYVIDYIINSEKFDVFRFLISSNAAHKSSIYDELFKMFDYFENKIKDKDIDILIDLQSSIDFPENIHNHNRITPDGKSTYSKVRHNYTNNLKKLAKKNYKKLKFSYFAKATYDFKSIPIKIIGTLPKEINEETFRDLDLISKIFEKDSTDVNFNVNYYAGPITISDYSLEEGLKNYLYYKNIYDEFEKLYIEGKLNYVNALFFIPAEVKLFLAELLGINLDLLGNISFVPTCKAGINFVGIRYDGNIYPCHNFFTYEFRNDFKVGNIFEDESSYDENLLQTMLNTYYLLTETYDKFEKEIFIPKYSKNLKEGSFSNISKAFYNLIFRHFCFAETCESCHSWSNIALDSWLNLYPVEWLEMTLAFVSKYRFVFEQINNTVYNSTNDKCMCC
jgi:radical SAM protein with 4Fe4S-binding SPASM domain